MREISDHKHSATAVAAGVVGFRGVVSVVVKPGELHITINAEICVNNVEDWQDAVDVGRIGVREGCLQEKMHSYWIVLE